MKYKSWHISVSQYSTHQRPLFNHELAPIRVNTVCPGFVDADVPIPGRADYVRRLAPNLPLDRLGSAKEIAATYLYLFGNAYSTGSVIVVDGGVTC